jgi:predicted O-methyltransferase YrrM
MKQFEMREFVGSDGIVYEARDTTSAGHARELDLSLFQVLNDTPAWLTASERLLLFTLIYSLRPSRYLEIGVLYGGASLIVSKAMDAAGYDGRLTLIDPEPQIDPVHWDQMSGRSVLLEGRSPGAIPEARRAAGGPFDFVFIDAGHSTEAVTRDAEGVLPHVQDGAYLLFHDSYRAEIAEAIDRFTRIHLGSIVDFGTLTREFHSPEHASDGGDGERLSCGMRVLQVRRRHGRARPMNRLRGVGDWLGRRLRGIRQALRQGFGTRG